MSFKEKLVILRKQKGFSQEEVAEKLDVSRQAVSRWESGSTTPDMPNLLKLSKLFQVSADYLINDDYEEETSKDNLTNENIVNDENWYEKDSVQVKAKEGKKTKKRAIRYLICGVLWIFAAICYTISSVISSNMYYIGLILLDLIIAGCNFCACKKCLEAV